MPDHARRKRRRTAQFRRRTPPGAAPGTLVPDPAAPAPALYLFAYGGEELVERAIAEPQEARQCLGRVPVLWLNVDGLGNVGQLRALGEIFGLHALELEDVIHVHQRPKVEDYGSHLFIVMRMIEPAGDALVTDQLSLFLGSNFVLTFQERPGDCFAPVRDRLRRAEARIRHSGPDYLAYALVDAVVDGMFPILERAGDRLEELEERVICRPDPATVTDVQETRRELLMLRRTAWPQREALSILARDPNPLITPETRLYLRDCYDHSVQILDLLEVYRELGSGLMDIYLSSLSNRLNEVMRVLTLIATIFIPLTFIAGIYGMNFDPGSSPWNMPELRWRWGYPACLALMAAIAAAMLAAFARKGWIPGARRRWKSKNPPSPSCRPPTSSS